MVVALTAAATIGMDAGIQMLASPVYGQQKVGKRLQGAFQKKDTLTLALTGDVMMGTTYPDTALPYRMGAYLFRDTKAILQRADVAAGNLEGTLCDGCESRKKVSKISYAFSTPVAMSGLLKAAGYDFMSLANNHSFDFGLAGLRQTTHTLDSLGISYAGIEGQCETAIIARRGLKIGFCAFGHNAYTVKHTDSLKVFSVINRLRPLVDVLVVSFHGGAEGAKESHLPYGKEVFLEEHRGYIRDFAHYCIDLGADVVYGHGPHVVRCMEVYKQRFIAYSLGNFCTPKGINVKGISGYAPVVEVKVDEKGRFLRGKVHPFVQQWGVGPRTDRKGLVINQLRRLNAADVPQSEAYMDAKGNILYKKR